MDLTTEMKEWLNANRDAFEFYVLNKMFHDRGFRGDALSMLQFEDFSDDCCYSICAALLSANDIMKVIPGSELPEPPTWNDLSTYMEVANTKHMLHDDDDVPGIMSMVAALGDPYKEQWYLVDTYFTAWVTDSRARRYARQIQAQPVIDSQEVTAQLQRDHISAERVVYDEADDEWLETLHGTTDEVIKYRSTGIREFDECTGGGLGEGECGLVFSGSGGGKTICCAQMAAHELSTHDGYPLVISTEMKPIVYLSRMISNLCNVNIQDIRGLRNVNQLKGKLLALSMPKYTLGCSVIEKFISRMRVERIDASLGLSGAQILEKYVRRFEDALGSPPTSIHFDWLGDVADQNQASSSSDRTMQWEFAANSMVSFAEDSGIPVVVYAQAVNNAQTKVILSLDDIGISKGIAKKMYWALGITNTLDKQAAAEALRSGESIKNMTLPEQRFCLAKARNGEGSAVAVRRDFGHQRFIST